MNTLTGILLIIIGLFFGKATDESEIFIVPAMAFLFAGIYFFILGISPLFSILK